MHRLKCLERLYAPVTRINIDDEDAEFRSRSNADVGVRPLRPPLADYCRIGGCVMNPMLATRVFSGAFACPDTT
jgi:hypothetical protein